MTLATTIARAKSVAEGVSQVGIVHVQRLSGVLEREELERLISSGDSLNALFISFEVHEVHEGAQLTRTECDVHVDWWYRADSEAESRQAMLIGTQALQLAWMQPTTGFPQIAPGGFSTLIRPDEPVRLSTGHTAYRSRFRFGLLDVTST